MLGLRQHVVLLAAIGSVRVPHETQLLEHVERPIDRGWDGRGVFPAAALDELRARDMAVGMRQDVHQQPPLWCPAKASRAQLVPGTRPPARGDARRGGPG